MSVIDWYTPVTMQASSVHSNSFTSAFQFLFVWLWLYQHWSSISLYASSLNIRVQQCSSNTIFITASHEELLWKWSIMLWVCLGLLSASVCAVVRKISIAVCVFSYVLNGYACPLYILYSMRLLSAYVCTLALVDNYLFRSVCTCVFVWHTPVRQINIITGPSIRLPLRYHLSSCWLHLSLQIVFWQRRSFCTVVGIQLQTTPPPLSPRSY